MQSSLPVFNNNLKNAIAYSYENSIIDISANQQDGIPT
jgi:two-component system sensor histidine kinase VanS